MEKILRGEPGTVIQIHVIRGDNVIGKWVFENPESFPGGKVKHGSSFASNRKRGILTGFVMGDIINEG
jgi:hypothetical protein